MTFLGVLERHVMRAVLGGVSMVVLVLLSLIFSVLLAPLGAGFALRTLSNTVFLGALVLVLFALIESLRGKEADIPTISEAVRMQLY